MSHITSPSLRYSRIIPELKNSLVISELKYSESSLVEVVPSHSYWDFNNLVLSRLNDRINKSIELGQQKRQYIVLVTNVNSLINGYLFRAWYREL